jgi:8-amino-7-oxononanoate synthase
MSPFLATLEQDLAALAQAARARQRCTVELRDGVHARVDGRDLLTFCSNDYLGLAQHPAVTQALCDAANRWGAGSGASHLVSGHCSEHHALEEELADFVGRPRALLFSTGYMANLAIATTLLGRGDRVCEDRLNHASLLDAGLASGARFSRYAHADAAALRRRLQRSATHDKAPRRTLVLTDGVFSMDGDLAPLPELARACRESGAVLVVDDAHGCGVLGATGAGSIEACGLGGEDVPVLMGTLGKAFGTFGAFVAGEPALIETLLQRARTYIYTTALPPAVAAATRAALRTARSEPERRATVLARAQAFAAGCAHLGLSLLPSATPIQPIVLGSEQAACAASAALRELGIWVPAIRPPTVPAGSSRLRCTFSATHTAQHVQQLLDALRTLQRRGLLPAAAVAQS